MLAEQDRANWDRQLMNRALYHLDRAASGQTLSEYHLEASIAACHATAPNYESTNWKAILGFYDLLIAMNRSPVLLLNRAVALCMVEGTEAGLKELDQLKDLPSLKDYYLLPATYAEFHRRANNKKKAQEYYEKTLELIRTKPERQFILKRLNEVSRVGS